MPGFRRGRDSKPITELSLGELMTGMIIQTVVCGAISIGTGMTLLDAFAAQGFDGVVLLLTIFIAASLCLLICINWATLKELARRHRERNP